MLFDSDLERKWYNGLVDILGHIRAKIGEDMFEFSKHALDQSVVRKISL